MAIVANRYWILLALFVAAATCYSLGFVIGFWLFIVVGIVFEVALWRQLFKLRRHR
jgi:hypothetical protein